MRNAALKLAFCTLLTLGGLANAVSPSVAAEPQVLKQPRSEDIVGTFSCTAVSCHGGGGPRYWSESSKGAEYVHWLGSAGTFSEGRQSYDPRAKLIKSDGDPHARAAQRMQEPRFQEVLRKASGRADGSADPTMTARCAKCHDPGAKSRTAEHAVRNALEGITASAEQLAVTPARSPHGEPDLSLSASHHFRPSSINGVGCETCHGGARQWLTVHYQTGVSRDELLRLGMIDTKSLAVRAKLCASCHIGSADQDMNHDMIAAGHPPLRFEQASYEALLGRKHWDDAPARTANPNYEVHLWASGRIAAAQAALALLESRAQESEISPAKPWPEFAESNCLACHQPLRKNDIGQSLFGALHKRGTAPAWQTWNTALLEAALFERKSRADELPAPISPSQSAMKQLRLAMDQNTSTDRHKIAALAHRAGTDLDKHVPDDLSSVTALSVLQTIGNRDEKATWDELCQQLAALTAARRALLDQNNLSAGAADDLHRRTERVAAALRFVSPNREWPVLYTEQTALSSAEILQELTNIRHDLLLEARE